MDLCLVVEQKTGLRLYMQWWEHTAMYILGIRAGHVAEEGRGKTGLEELEGKGEGD